MQRPPAPGFSYSVFTYDGDGKRVKSDISANGSQGAVTTTTYFVGAYYEVTKIGEMETITKYYYAGSQRIAMRTNGTLNFIVGDHLGSTSLVTDANGENEIETRYGAWGEVRFTTPDQTLPTHYTYTGQYSDSYINLLWYGSRHYDPQLGRFISPDSIVPTTTQGVQAYDRYAYVNNNPLRFTDPTGHMVDDGDNGGVSCKLLGTCPKVYGPPKPPTVPTYILGNPINPTCNGLEDLQGEVLSPRPIGYGDDDLADAYTALHGPDTPVFPWDYAIAAFDLKNYLETNLDFRNTEYDIWNLPSDVNSGLYYVPAANGIKRADESGVLMTGLFVTNNFSEDIERVNLKIEMRNSNSIILAADETQIFTPIQSGSSANLFGTPIFAPTNTMQSSVTVSLQLYTANYQGQIIHTIP